MRMVRYGSGIPLADRWLLNQEEERDGRLVAEARAEAAESRVAELEAELPTPAWRVEVSILRRFPLFEGTFLQVSHAAESPRKSMQGNTAIRCKTRRMTEVAPALICSSVPALQVV